MHMAMAIIATHPQIEVKRDIIKLYFYV